MYVHRSTFVSIIFVIGLVVGYAINYLIHWVIANNRNEEIVSAEVALLQRLKSVPPPCGDLAQTGVWLQMHNDAYVIWSLKPGSENSVEKLAIDKNMVIAQEQEPIYCDLPDN